MAATSGMNTGADARGRWRGDAVCHRGGLCCQDGAESSARCLCCLLTPCRSCRAGWERLWSCARTLLDASRRQPGGCKALLVPPCWRQSPALSPRISEPSSKMFLIARSANDKCVFFFSTAGCPSHPWLRGNASLLLVTPRPCTPKCPLRSPAPNCCWLSAEVCSGPCSPGPAGSLSILS